VFRHKLRVKALLLDLDGTLVDSTEALKEAGKAGFAAIGKSSLNNDEIAFEIARRLEQDLAIDDLFSGLGLGKEIEEDFLPAYLNAYYSAVITMSKPFRNVKETLRTLSTDFPLALVTLRYVVREQVVDELRHLGLKRYFKIIVTALDVKKPKPFPDALIAAAKKLQIPIEDCAIVGDSVVDIQAGRAAGAKTIAVLSGLFNRGVLEKEKPNLIIENVNFLPSFLWKG
jgi:phosphoglycolate phosphatase